MRKPGRGRGCLTRKGTIRHAAPPNQRRFRRYGVKLSCRVKLRESLQSAILPELEVETQNVSSGGLFFLGPAEWSVGTALEFELALPAHVLRNPVKIRCRGTITRVVPQEGGRIGIGATIDHYKISPLNQNFHYHFPPTQKIILTATQSNCELSLQCELLSRATEGAIRVSRKNLKGRKRSSFDPCFRHILRLRLPPH